MTTPDRIASQAAERVRQFNHATIVTGDSWQYPPHAYAAIGQLAHLARMLPQAIEQTALPVEHTHKAGRVLIDGGSDPAPAVEHLREAVKTASDIAGLLAQALDHVHSASRSMGLDTRGLPEFED
ncbi:hypothetical protein RI578_06620 [Streptomyces sp. BB1-1-1]|uniref:hypothetical protein n=1 Tax=Streptomyces sp. BB1-1-1 TaxID=3074430 RepID=UPI0028772733|nr:hypothetical protein [Streptomyces sp. BB1-1-1]WND33987.1 hypothetical protein RI578_06620 [Streptomyces sp. BB1-1-1]